MDPTTAYDDRPISMYDNLNMTNNVNTTSTPKTKLNEPVTMSPSSTSTSTSKTNGAAHSSPFTDITFKFNDNNNTNGTPLLNGRNRNLNEMPPNAMTALYSTPYKMANTPSITKPAIITTTTASPPPQYAPSLAASEASIGNTFTTSLSPSAAAATATTTSSSPAPAQLLAPPIAALAEATTANNSTINASRLNERPLSQHSQFELNETIHSIAAVKAALNEAKSKFFGINGYGPQHQPFVDPHESQRQNLLSSSAATQPVVVQQKPQPKYQNIPENSALFRTPTANVAPELPPKPIEYQNLNKTPTPPNKNPSSSINNNSPVDPHHQLSRKMPDGTIYNQISLNDLDGGRSQTVYMATTVPQNIKGNKIAGRHTPTRSSLRHSRMLVVSNKHYEEIKHPNPMGFHQPNLARWLLILQIIIGILLISLSVWIFVLSPNTPIQDNPYWCGLVLLITGIIGLILIRYHRIKRDKTREHCFIFLRMDSYVLALLSLLLCCVALIFAAIHYSRITASDTKCESVHMLIEHGSCVCTFHAPPLTNNATETSLTSSTTAEETTNATGQEMVDNSYKFEYRDLSCDEVTGPWTTILGLSFIINSVGFIISFVYMILLACCRSASKRSYTTVRTSTF
ncbi:mucin-2 isoform X2 [Musca domestica]|uniref:GPI-anchored protein pfl2 isoform X2 n=1 Tax=Musca domestica TaxID=7370 RepID=A0A1I8NDG3_MUSDO|nr:mucin-2 isoform X2 [Musca domestica]